MKTLLDAFVPQGVEERRDLERVRTLLAESADPWTRASSLHITGSAVVVHPPTRRVLLRWHDRLQAWLQVGGHADPGETDPFVTARREAEEETGLTDLVPWLDGAIVQVTVVLVPAGKGEPEHEHADIRYALATRAPEAIRAETDSATLVWLSVEEAVREVGWDNLRVCLERIARRLT